MAADEIATIPEFLVIVEDASDIGPRATGTVTVATFPVVNGTVVTHGDLTMTANDGGSTSGANNFHGNDTDADTAAANFAAAVNDPNNAWAAAGVEASVLGAVVTLAGTRGYDGNVALTSSDASITVTGMTGGDAWLTHALNEFAANFLDPGCWGNWLNMASIYVAAHVLTQLPKGLTEGSSPEATSINIGSISKSFAVASPTDDRFGSTKWGKLYLSLAEVVMCAPGGVAGSGGEPLGVVG